MRGDAAYCEHMRMVSIALTYAKEMREGVKCLIIVVIETTSLKTFFFFCSFLFFLFQFLSTFDKYRDGARLFEGLMSFQLLQQRSLQVLRSRYSIFISRYLGCVNRPLLDIRGKHNCFQEVACISGVIILVEVRKHFKLL